MKKGIILFIVAFFAGFLVHALFFPDFLANGIMDVAQVALPIATPTPVSSDPQSAFENKITYDGTHFSRHNLTMGVGNYLTIVNEAEHSPMWLISNDPNLATARGYGQTEQVRERMDTKGQFVVADKNNQSERLVITVK